MGKSNNISKKGSTQITKDENKSESFLLNRITRYLGRIVGFFSIKNGRGRVFDAAVINPKKSQV